MTKKTDSHLTESHIYHKWNDLLSIGRRRDTQEIVIEKQVWLRQK